MINYMDYDYLKNILSVSSGDNASVSGGDNISVSGGDNTLANIYIVGLPQEETNAETVQEPLYTLFTKPLEQYTVSEGLLFILVTLAVIVFIWKAAKGGLSWLGW